MVPSIQSTRWKFNFTVTCLNIHKILCHKFASNFLILLPAHLSFFETERYHRISISIFRVISQYQEKRNFSGNEIANVQVY